MRLEKLLCALLKIGLLLMIPGRGVWFSGMFENIAFLPAFLRLFRSLNLKILQNGFRILSQLTRKREKSIIDLTQEDLMGFNTYSMKHKSVCRLSVHLTRGFKK